MGRYRLSGFILESGVPLPELPPASGDPSYVFEVDSGRRPAGRVRWYHHWLKNDTDRWLSFARTPTGYLLRFPSYADFELSRDVSHIVARPRRGVPPDTLRHLLLDQVWPLVLSGSGRLVIHASAVVLPDGRAIAFAGGAGAGKSSLAASLAASGCLVVSDDCLLLEKSERGWSVVPSYPGLRLWPDMLARLVPGEAGLPDVAHYTSKKRVPAGALAFAGGPAPLAALYMVRRSAGAAKARVTARTGAEALMALVPFTYLLDCESREQLERSFAGLSALTTTVPVLGLEVPHAARRLGEVTELLVHRRST
jgi:hypothetical protein